jgi:dTMP kinase
MMKRGKLIVLEGIDGSGKTTLAYGLESWFKGLSVPVVVTKQPGGTQIGAMVRALIQHPPQTLSPQAELLFFAADRAQHTQEFLLPTLFAGTTVICDRFIDSSYAYQGYGKGADLTFLTMVNEWATVGLKPDLTIYLALSYQDAMVHMKKRQATEVDAYDQAGQEFFKRVIQGYQLLYNGRADVLMIDATQSIEQVLAQTQEGIVKMIGHDWLTHE